MGKDEIELKIGGKVKLRDLLSSLARQEHALSRAIEPDGRVRPGYLVFINDADYMVYQGLETEVGDDDVITIMPISHGGSGERLVEGDVEIYRRIMEDLERRCRVRYYRGYGGGELATHIERILSEKCKEQAYFLLLGSGFLISRRVAIAALMRVERVRRGSGFIARKPSIELLLRILGTRNIARALESVGSMGVGEKNVVIIACGECDTGDLGEILVSVEPGEDDVRRGLRNIAKLCLEHRSYNYDLVDRDIEDLEKLVISCGASLELEE